MHIFATKQLPETPIILPNTLKANEKLKDYDRQELEALKIRTEAHFTEEGGKSTRYFHFREKRQRTAQSITTLTKDSLDTITAARELLLEHANFINHSTPLTTLILPHKTHILTPLRRRCY